MADSLYSLPRKVPIQVPARSCPRCTSVAVIATAKNPDADSYWRCNNCGEVWSPARRTSEPSRQRW